MLEPGSVVDDYTVGDCLGSGASAIVYAATKLSNGKPVALKVLRPELAGDAFPEERARFLREVSTCIALSHPNIVPIIDSGVLADGVPFAAYERVPGETLKVLLERDGALPFRDVAWLMAQVLRALMYAHNNRVIHRDIKPANLMISGTSGVREARVLDFGIAGRVHSLSFSKDQSLTAQGLFIGTPLYACLDQIRGRPPQVSWDLFAWGLVFLEALSGEHPCAGSGRMPWDPEREFHIPQWLLRHRLGQLLERVLLSEHMDVRGTDLLTALDSALRELNPPRSSTPDAFQRRWVCVGACRFTETSAAGSVDIQSRDIAIRACQDLGAALVEKLGGRVLSRVGDRLLFGFGYGEPHEDDAARAVRASRSMLDALSEVARGTAQVDVQARIGLHAGEAVFEGQTNDGFADVAGATPEGAALIGELCQPGDIVVSETVRALLRVDQEFELLREVQLPAMHGRVSVYRIAADARVGIHESAPRTPFVGRDSELRQLVEYADGAAQGKPKVISIVGEPGIGKSRLLLELRSRVSASWLECRCQPDDGASPYQPFAQLIERLGSPEDLLRANGLASEINIALLEAMRTGDVSAVRAMGVSSERQRELLRELLIRLLTTVAEHGSFVLAIEDLHWADPSSVQLISQLVAEVAGWSASHEPLNLLTITTARPTFTPPWTQGVVPMVLEELSNEDVEALVRGLNIGADTARVRTIQNLADGIPLFAEEIALAGTSPRQAGRPTTTNVPAILLQYLAPRLDALSQRAQEIVRIASVLGREFDDHLLALLLDRPAERIAQDLSELVQAGIIYRRRTANRAMNAFKHGLIRDVAYERIPRNMQPGYHARVADTLVQQLPELAARRPETVASHLYSGGRVNQAIEWWNTAVFRLIAGGAYDEAQDLGRRALEASGELVNPIERSAAELAVRELLGTAVSSKIGLGADEVRQIYSPALELCEKLGSALPLGVLWGIWSFTVVSNPDAEITGQLISHFLDAAARDDEPVARATAHSAAGTRKFLLGDVRGSLEHFAIAELAGQTPEFQRSVRYYDVGMYIPAWQMSALGLCGDFDGASRIRNRLLETARAQGSPAGLSIVLAYALNSFRIALDYAGTIELANEQIRLCDEQRIIAMRGAAQCSRGWARVCIGEADGIDEIRQGLALCAAIGMRLNQVLHLSGLAEAELRIGNAKGALDVVGHALEQSSTTIERYQDAELLRIRGESLRVLGDLEGAEVAFREALAQSRKFDIYAHELKAMLSLADLLSALHGRQAARRLLEQIALPKLIEDVPLVALARRQLESLSSAR